MTKLKHTQPATKPRTTSKEKPIPNADHRFVLLPHVPVLLMQEDFDPREQVLYRYLITKKVVTVRDAFAASREWWLKHRKRGERDMDDYLFDAVISEWKRRKILRVENPRRVANPRSARRMKPESPAPKNSEAETATPKPASTSVEAAQ